MDRKACVSVCMCARVSRLTIFHLELWQPYSSVARWQLLLNSDIKLQMRKQSTGQKVWIETTKSVRVERNDCGWNGP